MARKLKDQPNANSGDAVAELIREKLLILANADSPMRLDAKKGTDYPPLFPGKAGVAKAAMEQCLDSERALLAVVGSGKTAQVQLTQAGCQLIAKDIPAEKLHEIAQSVAAELSTVDRIDFLQELVRQNPLGTEKLLPILQNAVAQEQLEAKQRDERETKRREAELASLAAMERWKAAIEQRNKDRIELLKKELTRLAGNADHSHAAPRKDIAALPQPVTAEDQDFRRDVASALVASWLETYRLNNPQGRVFLETAMGNIRGLRQIGEVDEHVSFDRKYHVCQGDVSTGTPVKIVQPGWVLEEENGDYRLVPATVQA